MLQNQPITSSPGTHYRLRLRAPQQLPLLPGSFRQCLHANSVYLLSVSATFSEDGKVTAVMSTSRRCSAIRLSASTAVEGTSVVGEITGLCFCCCCCCCWWCFRWRLCRWCFPLDFVCSWSRRPPSPILLPFYRHYFNISPASRKQYQNKEQHHDLPDYILHNLTKTEWN